MLLDKRINDMRILLFQIGYKLFIIWKYISLCWL